MSRVGTANKARLECVCKSESETRILSLCILIIMVALLWRRPDRIEFFLVPNEPIDYHLYLYTS
jgi:hypothetical protein